jgi:rhodanese-related sulfurtransferase
MEQVFIDVREKDEFKNEHIFGSINLPLSCFQQEASALLEKLDNKRVIIMCLSGKRAVMAFDHIKSMPNLNCENYEIYPDGIKGWKKSGKKVVVFKKGTISIMRQVQITAGILIILGGVLGTLVNTNLWFISAFIGAGLTFAGLTGTCGLAGLLKIMPWNRCSQ